jgi:predicted enzyme related to lactoylglutathione lyase
MVAPRVAIGLAVGVLLEAATAGCATTGAPEKPETKNSAMNPVVYFEVPVQDLERAIAFYGKVFGYAFERATIDGNEMALFPADRAALGVSGALAKGESYVPGKQGVRVYFNTLSIDDTLRRVELAGGRVLYPKTSLGEAGWVAEFEDSEGNCIALHSEGRP